MTLLLPRLTKGVEPSLRVWRQRRAFVAPIGKVFPKAPDLSVEPDETLDLTTVSLNDKLPSGPSKPKPLDGLDERKSDDCCTIPYLPELPGLPRDRRAAHTTTKPPITETPVFCLKGEARRDPRSFARAKTFITSSIENSPGGMTLKKICSELQPWLQDKYGEDIGDMNFKEELRKLLFIKKMRIYLEIRKRAYSPEVKCIPIFHCPRCLEHWTELGWAPEACDNELQPTRGPEVTVTGTKMRFIPMYHKGKGHTLARGRTVVTREKALCALDGLSSSQFLEVRSKKRVKDPTSTPSPSRDSAKQPRDINEHIGVEEEVRETAPDLLTVTESTGEKLHINQTILDNLNLDDMSDDEAIELLFECRAIQLEGLLDNESPLKGISFSHDHYDVYARGRKEDTKDQNKSANSVFIHQYEKEDFDVDISNTNVNIIRRVSRSFDSLVNKESTEVNTGENVKNDIKFRDTNKIYAGSLNDISMNIRAKDLPVAIREKLLKILHAQRLRRQLEREQEDQSVKHDTSMEDDDDSSLDDELVDSDKIVSDSSKGMRRTSLPKGPTIKHTDSSNLESREERASKTTATAEMKGRDKGQGKGMTSLPQGSKRILDKRKQSVPIPKKVWEDTGTPDKPSSRGSTPVQSPTDSQVDSKRASVFGKTDHFQEASEVLQYTEKQRRRRKSKLHTQHPNQPESSYGPQSTGKTPLGTRRSLDSESTVPRHKEVSVKVPTKRGKDSFSYASRKSSSFGLSDNDSFTQASSHLMYQRKGSKGSGPFEGQDSGSQRDVRRTSRRLSKKERKESVKRPNRALHSKEIQNLSTLEDPTVASQETMVNIERQAHVNVADATQWFDDGSSFCDEHVNSGATLEIDQTTTESPQPVFHYVEGTAGVSTQYTKERSKSLKIDSLRKLEILEDDFHSVIRDAVDVTVDHDVPVMSIVVEEKEESTEESTDESEKSDLFEEVSNPSSTSSFTKWNFINEIHRLPVSNAFTFSFYELPAQHKIFNKKIEMAAAKIGNKKWKMGTKTKSKAR